MQGLEMGLVNSGKGARTSLPDSDQQNRRSSMSHNQTHTQRVMLGAVVLVFGWAVGGVTHFVATSKHAKWGNLFLVVALLQTGGAMLIAAITFHIPGCNLSGPSPPPWAHTPWEVAQDRGGPRPGDGTRLDALLGRFAGPGPLLVLCCIRLVLNGFSTTSKPLLLCWGVRLLLVSAAAVVLLQQAGPCRAPCPLRSALIARKG
jgi:hypothetical protein